MALWPSVVAPHSVLYIKSDVWKKKTVKSKLMALSVCGYADQATKAKNQSPSTDSPVYPELYSELHQAPKTEQSGKQPTTESPWLVS